MQIKIYCELYMSECLKEKKEKVIDKLKKNELQPFLYVITLSQGEQNNLEFYSSLLCRQKLYRNTSVFVVGLAVGYDEAMRLTEDIVTDVYHKTDNGDIRGYICKRQKEYEESGE